MQVTKIHQCGVCKCAQGAPVDQIKTDDELLEEYLHAAYHDYLCENCTSRIQSYLNQLAQKSTSAQGDNGIVKHYQEGEYLVFTMDYHLKKGYCCQSKCRHCPYGFNEDAITEWN